jgi:uncharacterized protein
MKYNIKVMPHSMREEVSKQGDTYIVRVKAAAQDGKANEAVMELLGKHFKVPKSSIVIVTGKTSHNKIIEIRSR